MKKVRSVDLREQALACAAGGMRQSEVCRVFGIHRSTLRRWRVGAAQGNLAPRQGGGNPRKIVPAQEEALVRQLQAAADATVDEHVEAWQKQTGHTVSRSAMGRALLRVGWTRKKRA